MDEASRFPFDLDTIGPGFLIGPELIQKLDPDSPPGTDRYRLSMMKMRDKAGDALKARGLPGLSVVAKGYSLRVLSAKETAEYEPEEVRRGFRRVAKHITKMTAIDRNELDAHERQRLNDQQDTFNVMRIAAARAKRHNLKLIANKRNTPGLPFKPDDEEN